MSRGQMAYNDFFVPPANSANNVTAMDVVGNKSDDESGDSLYSKAYITEKNVHSECEVYPPFSVAAGIVITSSATPLIHGSITQVIPASTVASPFDIHWINVLDASATTGKYELKLYRGDTDILIATVQFAKTANLDAAKEHQCMTILIPANEKVSASLATDNSSADTVDISSQFHRY